MGVGRESAPGDRVGRLLPPTITLSHSMKPAFCLLIRFPRLPRVCFPRHLVSAPAPGGTKALCISDLVLLVSFQVPIRFYGRCLQDCRRRWLWACSAGPQVSLQFVLLATQPSLLSFSYQDILLTPGLAAGVAGQSPGLP